VPVIISSGYGEVAIQNVDAAGAAVLFVQKPYSAARLCEQIRPPRKASPQRSPPVFRQRRLRLSGPLLDAGLQPLKHLLDVGECRGGIFVVTHQTMVVAFRSGRYLVDYEAGFLRLRAQNTG
jgi:hypothetical protein